MDNTGLDYISKPLGDFVKNSVRLIKRCTKPDQKEFTKICIQTALGFAVLGFLGFFVKLIFIVNFTDAGQQHGVPVLLQNSWREPQPSC